MPALQLEIDASPIIIHTTSHQNATKTTANASDGMYGTKRGVIPFANTVRYRVACPSPGNTICMISKPA